MQLTKQDLLLLLQNEPEAHHFSGLLRAFGGRHIKTS